MALVGCGSAGSKIGVSLARSGVGHFVLVDDDVLLPGNLVRNEMDWRDVGGHKADVLADRLKLVNPAATADARRLRLSAQEASGSAAAALRALSDKPEPACKGCRAEAFRPPTDATRPEQQSGCV